VKLVHIVGFITKKFVTMHGHMNAKFYFSIQLVLCISVPWICLRWSLYAGNSDDPSPLTARITLFTPVSVGFVEFLVTKF